MSEAPWQLRRTDGEGDRGGLQSAWSDLRGHWGPVWDLAHVSPVELSPHSPPPPSLSPPPDSQHISLPLLTPLPPHPPSVLLTE